MCLNVMICKIHGCCELLNGNLALLDFVLVLVMQSFAANIIRLLRQRQFKVTYIQGAKNALLQTHLQLNSNNSEKF